MRRGLFVFTAFLALITSCISLRDNATTKKVKLDFSECGEELTYQFIEIELKSDYSQERIEDEYGFCEYRMIFEDGSIFYFTSNIYSGSKLNYDNRLRIGVKTYSVNRAKSDTISFGGKQENTKLWKESIIGSYGVGYVDAEDFESFEKAIKSVKLIQKN